MNLTDLKWPKYIAQKPLYVVEVMSKNGTRPRPFIDSLSALQWVKNMVEGGNGDLTISVWHH